MKGQSHIALQAKTDDQTIASSAQSSVSGAAPKPVASTEIAERMLADIAELGPTIVSRTAEIENGRRIPLDLVERLRSIGIFRMFVPRSHGGLELDFVSGMAVFEALGRIDGSVGWVSMLGGGSGAMATGLQHETYEQVYRNSPDIIFAGSEQPAGRAEPVEGGFQVNGRWPFASGCQQADWMFCVCVMTEDGQPLPGPVEGMPKVRGFVLPAHQWQIEDTWYAAGLKGTGSHHITLTDTFVPAANFLDRPGQACVSGPLYYAARHLIPAMHIAIAVGIARGALDDLVVLANTGRRQQLAPAPMRDTETFRYELGRTQAEFNAAQALARDEYARIWRHAIGGTLNDVAIHTQSTQAAIWITAACLRVADACFALCGRTEKMRWGRRIP